MLESHSKGDIKETWEVDGWREQDRERCGKLGGDGLQERAGRENRNGGGISLKRARNLRL